MQVSVAPLEAPAAGDCRLMQDAKSRGTAQATEQDAHLDGGVGQRVQLVNRNEWLHVGKLGRCDDLGTEFVSLLIRYGIIWT